MPVQESGMMARYRQDPQPATRHRQTEYREYQRPLYPGWLLQCAIVSDYVREVASIYAADDDRSIAWDGPDLALPRSLGGRDVQFSDKVCRALRSRVLLAASRADVIGRHHISIGSGDVPGGQARSSPRRCPWTLNPAISNRRRPSIRLC